MPWSRLCFVFILLVVATSIGSLSRETFIDQQPSWDVLTTNPLQYSSWIASRRWKLRSFQYDVHTWKEQTGMLTNPTLLSKITENQNISIITDPYDASSIWKNNKRIATCPKGYFVLLFDIAKAIQVDCSYNFVGKSVGFFDRSDELFLRALLYGYRMPISAVKMEQIPINRWDQIAEELKRLDMIVCYIVPGSPFHKLLQTQDISVMGFKNLDINRVRLFYPYIQLEQVDLNTVLLDVPGSAMKIMNRARDTNLPSMSLQMIQLENNTTETFVTRIETDQEAIDPSFRCYGDESITSKTLCESKYDVIGLPKRVQTTWDRQCTKNTDCPFFQANKNYPNSRGGCNKDGFCEFPVGIKRIAYIKYDDTGVNAPFCYQCQQPSDPSCCKNQQNMVGLSSPDYAFPNDTNDRRKAGLTKITIGSL